VTFAKIREAGRKQLALVGRVGGAAEVFERRDCPQA
jgi:hypothetical protein